MPRKNIVNADYVDDTVLLENITTQVESRLHDLERPIQTKRSTCVLIKKETISTLYGGSQKLVEKFKYLVTSVCVDCYR